MKSLGQQRQPPAQPVTRKVLSRDKKVFVNASDDTEHAFLWVSLPSATVSGEEDTQKNQIEEGRRRERGRRSGKCAGHHSFLLYPGQAALGWLRNNNAIDLL